MDVALSDYRAAQEYLFARTTGALKFGLERTSALLEAMGDPHRAIPTLHIAGTNGKGSAVATAEALLRRSGLRVARYTSPHLVDFRERIVVDGVAIEPGEVVEFVARWSPLVERLGASFFELTTALAFSHFARTQPDVAVIETGLGGRLDATNVVHPRAAGVTSIGLDHTEFLGPTLAAIAREKAGIFKRGIPAVIGEPTREVRAWLAGDARAAGASEVRIVAEEAPVSDISVGASGTSFRLAWRGTPVRVVTPLAGYHQAANFAFAMSLLDAAGAPFASDALQAADAASMIRLPGRFQRVGDWIFDVAHNADGARALASTVRAALGGQRMSVLVCVLGDKDWAGMLDALAPVADHFILTDAPSAPTNRRWPLAAAAAHLRAIGAPYVDLPDFERALDHAKSTGMLTLVTGSFHTVGDAMACLQVSPLTG